MALTPQVVGRPSVSDSPHSRASGEGRGDHCHRQQRSREIPCRVVPDVVLPVLDEAEALPWVLGRMPDGYRAIVVDNGSADGSGEVARSLGALVVDQPQRGLRRRVLGGVGRRDRRDRVFHGRRRVAGPRRPAPRRRRRARGPGGPGARRPPGRAGRLAPARPARQPLPGGGTSSAGWGCRSPIWAPCAPPGARRCSGWGCRTGAPVGPSRWCSAPARAGWRVIEVPIPYRARTGRSKVTGTVKGTLRAVKDMRRTLATL